MVTSYYIMKMTQKNRAIDINEYYSSMNINCGKRTHKNRLACRICLKTGSLPIYGVENSSEIEKALQIFADINIYEDDEYPKHLCKMCYKFIKGAISFRKIAKQSEKILNLPVKEEPFDDYQAHEDALEVDVKVSEACSVKTETVGSARIEKEKEKAKKVQCYICNKIVTNAYLKEHLTMHDPHHHKYICEICGKSFRLRCSYHNHTLRHRTDFPYKCQFCPYKARYTELLKTHMRTHTGDYRYMCTECPARFLFKSNLNRHVLIKHREPQHHCDLCKKIFHTKVMLKRHYDAQHLGLKNHVCNLCGKAFGYRNAMMKHQINVHKREKKLFCRTPSYLLVENKSLATGDT